MRVDNSNHTQSIVTFRFFAVLLSLAWAFILNDITTIYFGNLAVLGFETDARIFQIAPLPLLFLWIALFQYWITKYRCSFWRWCCRLLTLYLLSWAIFGSIWLYAFRNTDCIQIQSIPEHSKIDEIEFATKLKLSWYGTGNAYYVMFDNRGSENKALLKNALQSSGVVFSQ